MKVITQAQLLKFFALYGFATIIAFYLSMIMQRSGFSALLGVAIGVIAGLALTFVAFKLGIRRPDEFFVDYGKDIVSRWVHYPILLLVVISNVLIISINLWELQDFLIQYYLTNTPSWVVVSFSSVCIAYTARFGIKSVFRTAEGIFYACLLVFLLLPFLVSNNIEWFLAKGFITHMNLKDAWPTGYFAGTVLGEMTFILYIIPYINQAKKSMRAINSAVMITTFVIFLHVGTIFLALGPDLTKNLNVPELEIIRYIKSGSYLEALDPVLIALWMLSVFVKLSFVLFVTGHIISHSLNLKYTKPVIFPIVGFACICTLCLAISHTQINTMLNGGVSTLFLTLELIPLLYFVVDTVKGSFRKKKESEELV